jgi:4-carboxymuconolactone decarboxylase
VGRSHGVTQTELTGLVDHHRSSAFDERDRTVLDYALAMTRTPVEVDDDLFDRLRSHLSDPQIVELTAAVAWENYRARFNHALLMEAEGFSEAAFCPIPDRPPLSAAQ